MNRAVVHLPIVEQDHTSFNEMVRNARRFPPEEEGTS